MAWYAVYEVSTGDLKGATSNINQVPEQSVLDSKGFAVKTFDPAPDLSAFGWNPATLEYDVALPTRYEAVDTFTFMNRWTQGERNALHTLSDTDTNVRDFIWRLGLTEFVRVDWAPLITAMDYLVTNGVLTQARRDVIMEV